LIRSGSTLVRFFENAAAETVKGLLRMLAKPKRNQHCDEFSNSGVIDAFLSPINKQISLIEINFEMFWLLDFCGFATSEIVFPSRSLPDGNLIGRSTNNSLGDRRHKKSKTQKTGH
jgi:hypothetical protein